MPFTTQKVVPLSVYFDGAQYHIVTKKYLNRQAVFFIASSEDGLNFPVEKELILSEKLFSLLSTKEIDTLSFSPDRKNFFAAHLQNRRRKFSVFGATRKIIAATDTMAGDAVLLPLQDGRRIAIISDSFFRVVEIEDKQVTSNSQLLFTSRLGFFDDQDLRIIAAWEREKDIVILYDASKYQKNDTLLQIGAARISKSDPYQLLWRSEQAIFEQLVEGKTVRAFGAICTEPTDHNITLYLDVDGNIFSLHINNPFVEKKYKTKKTQLKPISLMRHKQNPILSPKTQNVWEAEGVFNPAIFYDGKTVHALYRAVGSDGISRIGYASSNDGLRFDHRLPEPIFSIATEQTIPEASHSSKEFTPEFSRQLYGSGGSWVGCEDPRVVEIGKKVYMTYTAFGGWNLMRIALTSIKTKDLQAGKWNWAEPTYISPANRRDKNWVIFPEKIEGKIAVLHSLTPKIAIDYIDDLDQPFVINAKRAEGTQPGRRDYWDNKLRGAGAPPIKTRLGWLLLYHATDQYDTNCYKLGAMILDLKDPTKILYRSDTPILEPLAYYENDGKPGVVYATGAIVKDKKLFVYYGGGDKHTCVASIDLEKLLEGLVQHKKVRLEPEK